MKINLTKKQYEHLIKAVEAGDSVYGILGDSVSDAYKKQSDEIENLRRYLLSFAAEFGRKDMTEQFHGKTIMNGELSEKLHEAIEDYDDETFWHELETRLGKRDFEKTMTEAEKNELAEKQWYPERIHEIYESWSKEFEKNGVERLEIINGKK